MTEGTGLLHETFRAYVAAEAAATRAFIAYQFGEVAEAEVHRLQRKAEAASAVHVKAMQATA